MPQRILIELLLFATPFALFLVYRLGSREVSVRDRWPLTVLTSIGAGIAIIALVASPLLEPSNRGLCTKFARYEKGKVAAPEKIECNAGAPPSASEATANGNTTEILAPRPREDVPPAPTGPEPTAPFTPPHGDSHPG